jgi:uncharacterized protein (DUF2235 family)
MPSTTYTPSAESSARPTLTKTFVDDEITGSFARNAAVKAELGPDKVNIHEIIPDPSEITRRNLIVCFDGTGDQFDLDNSNIVQLVQMLKRDDRTLQMVYYQAGIGTWTIPDIASPWKAWFTKKKDQALGNHLDAHIQGGYEFLMQNYHPDDKIHIFGFSRGAYTARALAGMIHKIGLLPPSNIQQVPFAYAMYARDDPIGWKQSTQFKKAFSVDVNIEFVGVWDTVASVGLIPREMPFTKSNSHIRYFRHAISLDERRARFKPNLWNRPSPEEAALGVRKGTMQNGKKHRSHEDHPTGDESDDEVDKLETPTDIEEVWFAGGHCG